MKSSNVGNNSTATNVEVVHVSKHGFWVSVDDEELFLSFKTYPWFETATLASVFNVELLHGFHLRWPDLDVDLELDSLRHPENYPLQFDAIPDSR
jgi:hypothetical protein